MIKKEPIKDNGWWFWRRGKGTHTCCDCGLVHDVVMQVTKDKMIKTKWERNEEETTLEREILNPPNSIKELLNALDGLLNHNEGRGCPMCDDGKLRNPEKEHWDNCVWNNARLIYEKNKNYAVK